MIELTGIKILAAAIIVAFLETLLVSNLIDNDNDKK